MSQLKDYREALQQIASGDGVYGQQAGEYKKIARDVLEKHKNTRQRDWQKRMREQGRCSTCGDKCEINPRTGKPYFYCKTHR